MTKIERSLETLRRKQAERDELARLKAKYESS